MSSSVDRMIGWKIISQRVYADVHSRRLRNLVRLQVFYQVWKHDGATRVDKTGDASFINFCGWRFQRKVYNFQT